MITIIDELIKYLGLLSQRLAELLQKLKKLLRENKQAIYQATYALYGILDGISVTYSMLKYGCDLLATSSKEYDQYINNALSTPGGLFGVILESIVIISFSLFANTAGKNKSDFRRHFAIAWPYMRDTLKGLKNSYRGIKSLIDVTTQLGGQDLKMLVAPIGIIVGVVNILNRIWLRKMRNERKEMMAANKSLLKTILNAGKKDEDDDSSLLDYEKLYQEIKRQDKLSRYYALFGASIITGIADGFYLFMGILTVATITGPLLPVLVVCSLFFVIVNVVARINEEYEYQQKLRKTQLDCELALEGQQLRQAIEHLMNLRETRILNKKFDNSMEDDEYKSAWIAYQKLKSSYLLKKKERDLLIKPSITRAFFNGLRTGLSAYGVVASIMFAIATLMLLTSVAFPPLAVVAVIFTGLFSLLAFSIGSSISAYKEQKEQAKKERKEAEKTNVLSDEGFIIKFEKELKEDFYERSEIDKNHLKKAFGENLITDDSPQYHLQEGFEVVRSIASGLGKGQKTIEFTMHSMETQDSSGDSHETPIMVAFTCVMSLIYATCMGIRAIHRGFDRDSAAKKTEESSKEVPTKEIPTKEIPTKEIPTKEIPTKEIPIIEIPIKESKPEKNRQRALSSSLEIKSNTPWDTIHGFFSADKKTTRIDVNTNTIEQSQSPALVNA
jgi:hypothetical protein